MNLRDLRDISKKDILGAIGLEPKRSTGSWALGTFGLFGLGILVGAGVALLIAPKPGQELRREITRKLGARREAGNAAMDSSGI